MNKLTSIVWILFLGIFSIQAQSELNNYSTLLIPEQFEFQSSPNQYNINKTLKASFLKYNFKTYLNGEDIPEGVDPCDVLHLKINEKGFLSTKISFSFYDCLDKKVYTSIEGVSKIKEFQPSYYQAIRFALKDENIVQHDFTKESVIVVAPEQATLNKTPEKKPTTSVEVMELELRGKRYKLIPTNATDFEVYQNNKLVGTLIKQPENDYIMKAGTLSGLGTFDDFGNFNITRVNPANQAVITDTMTRVQ